MGELGALFNPGMRHEIEERQSKASRREEEGQADPGNLRIDLLSGVAVINMSGEHDEESDESDTDSDTDGDTENDRGEDHLVSGSAPDVAESVDATIDSEVDDVAMTIAEETSNDEAAT